MKIKILTLLLLTICLSIPTLALAETVFLKSGQKIEGKLLEKTDKYIKIDFDGVVLTYFLDEISNIEEEKKPEPFPAEDKLNKQENDTEEKNIPVEPLKAGPAGIAQLNKVYYNLKLMGLQKYSCEVTSNIFDQTKIVLKEKNAGDPKIGFLDSMKFYLHPDENGSFSFDHTPYTPTGNTEIDTLIKQNIDMLQYSLESFCDTWGSYNIEPRFRKTDSNFAIEKLPDGYTVSYKELDNDREVKISLDNKLIITEEVGINGDNINKKIPHFMESNQGLLIKGYESDANNGFIKSIVTISYQEIEGLQMPKQVIIKNSMSGKENSIELNFSNFKIEKRV